LLHSGFVPIAAAAAVPVAVNYSAHRTTWSLWRRPLASSVALAALAVIALNLLDAFCTLRHVQLGAIELNPLMRELLDSGPLAFLVGKHLLAAAGVLGIVAHSRHRTARRMLRFVLLPVYAAIGAYQILLFAVV
jgi:hypothetical protein